MYYLQFFMQFSKSFKLKFYVRFRMITYLHRGAYMKMIVQLVINDLVSENEAPLLFFSCCYILRMNTRVIYFFFKS